jgi:acetyl esterase/lipase
VITPTALALPFPAQRQNVQPPVQEGEPHGGRGDDVLPERPPDRRVQYAGDSPVQYGDLRLPAGPVPPAGHPVAVVIHGGAWHADWTSDYTGPLAEVLTRGGIATWNIDL